MTKKKKINIPQKGAAKKWSQQIKKIGAQKLPKEISDLLNKRKKSKKIAKPIESTI